MRRFFFAVFLVVACATGAAAGPLEEALSALESKDYALAERLLRPLAEQGDAQAQRNLGVMYANGRGVPQNDQEAVTWYRKAAEQGDAQAQSYLDDREKLKSYRKATEQGKVDARYNLGAAYAYGLGVPQDSIRALMWLNIAAVPLSDDYMRIAMKLRDRVAAQMTAAQIEKAQKMARRCQDTKFKECD